MSYFSSLSSTTQDLVMLNFEFFGKRLLIAMFLIFSFYYIFIYWKQKKESPYLMIGIGRLMIFIVSLIMIVASPLFIFFLFPQVGIDTLLQYLLIFYTVGFFVFTAIVILNISYYGIHSLMSFANVKIDPRAEKVKKKTLHEMIRLMGFKFKND